LTPLAILERRTGTAPGRIREAKEVLYTSMSSTPSSPPDRNDEQSGSLTLVQAMETADRIRQALLKRNDPTETGQMVPPGTLQGVSAFCATGLLLTPFRRSILKMTGPSGPFQGFVDLVITPVLAVGAAQVGLVIGTLYGSSYYLDRLASDAAITTTTSSTLGYGEVMSLRRQDDKISYSATTESIATERENTVVELCKEVLSLPLARDSLDETSENTSFASWDPRSKTMKSLLNAVDKCRRRET